MLETIKRIQTKVEALMKRIEISVGYAESDGDLWIGPAFGNIRDVFKSEIHQLEHDREDKKYGKNQIRKR